MYRPAIGSELNVHSFFKLINYKYHWRKEHPNEFTTNGILCFSGRQGNGKTLTAVKYIKEILKDYPRCIVVSNIDINGVNVIRYTGLADLLKIDNGDNGIILFFDEISNQFNSVTSKDINPEWFTIINMQRKRHMHIIGTCPILSRVGKAFREQFDVICLCDQWLGGFIQFNHYYINNCFVVNRHNNFFHSNKAVNQCSISWSTDFILTVYISGSTCRRTLKQYVNANNGITILVSNSTLNCYILRPCKTNSQ